MASKAGKLMREAQKGLKEIMQVQLAVIADNMISQVMAAARKLPTSKRLDALHGITPKGIQEYRSLLLDGIVLIAEDGIESARKEVPKAKKVKLARIDRFTPKLRDKMKTRTELLIGKQIGDLQKVIEFAYATNEDTTDSDDTVEQDLRDSALGWLDGTALEAGASITASTVINDARDAFFFDPEVLEEIEAFQFVNGDPVTDICQDLEGTIFAKDDPDMFRYTPPLHWNCKSYIIPIVNGNLKGREIEKLEPSTKELKEQIQFHDVFSIVKDGKESENGNACH